MMTEEGQFIDSRIRGTRTLKFYKKHGMGVFFNDSFNSGQVFPNSKPEFKTLNPEYGTLNPEA